MPISNESKEALRHRIKGKEANIFSVEKEISGLMSQELLIQKKIASQEELLSQVSSERRNFENIKAQLETDIQKMKTDIG